ncbi:D-alanyl-lipoteichoic acid biosynthesis protein DltD [Desulfitobacterium metallireducens]|uniref:Protein DltD n=1 Tax=Desulfitobacterium metallireducens DSM 15288 TaxID=871968 RepID=W0EHL9_9FIRM|nr:D-alanyl-lipoteichoic acid biosynthesis protein DltD [Desulfitobacterium metallireducens]AHF08684.1 hypothetical protein DESME_14420 [Desulfitobacterium metallireducens DSM 15288]
MFIRRFGPILLGFLLFGLTLVGMKPLTEYVCNQLWLNHPGTIEAVGRRAYDEVMLGNVLQAKALATPEVLPFYGSSELGTGFEFNPSTLFNQRDEGFKPFIIGRGSVQSLVNILNLAGQDHLQGRKMVFTFSPDWFAERHGLENDRLAMNSSPLHIYQTMLSPSLPAELKREIAQRILDIPQVLQDDPFLEQYLQAYKAPGMFSQIKRIAYWPQAEIECAALEVQDALKIRYLLNVVKEHPSIPVSPEIANQPWNTVIKKSEQRGKALISNKLNILDSLYEKTTKPETKKAWSILKLYPSKEYDDFDLMLRVLQQKGVKPLFVLIPANGLWADYAGFSPQERQDYYQRMRSMIQAKGFEIADFSSQEYEPYFMQDMWHIGTKGWAEVDKVINQYVHE